MSLQELSTETPAWYISTLLMGYRDQQPSSPVPLTKNMFDHSNPAGFQQVFHFLLSLLRPSRAKAEFRDCWPILDKKMEAEFRRKVVLLVKEVAKEVTTAPLPSVNPALFMAPGGSKFKSFLAGLTNHVLRAKLEKDCGPDGLEGDIVLGRPTCRGKLRSACYRRFVKMEAAAMKESAAEQEAIRGLEDKARGAVQEVTEEYFTLKRQLEQLEKESQEQELAAAHPDLVVEGKLDKEAVLGYYDQKCAEVKEVKEQFVTESGAVKEHCLEIMSVVDSSRPKLSLDLDPLPRDVVDPSSLTATYAALTARFLDTAGKAVELPHPSLPCSGVSAADSAATQQGLVLGQLRKELGDMATGLRENVRAMLEQSSRVDWDSLGPQLASDQELLLPPTPSLLPSLSRARQGQEPGLTPKLQLASPVPSTPAPNPGMHLQVPGGALTTPPHSLGQVTRRFPRKVTPDQSPLLRQSLIANTLRRVEDGQDESSKDLSKDSLGIFSPVLSSTISTSTSLSSPTQDQLELPRPSFRDLRLQSEEDEVAGNLGNDTVTADKIAKYREVLGSVRRAPGTVSPARAGLQQVWSRQQEALSSLTPGPGLFSGPSSPAALGSEWETPHLTRRRGPAAGEAGQGQMDSTELASRLDILMQDSMVLSDSSTLDLSLGSLSLGEADFLSPHTK